MKRKSCFGIKVMGLIAAAVLLLTVSASVTNAQDIRAFTLTGAVGTLDEDSLAIAQFRNFAVLHQTGATGSIHVRYNLTAVDGLTRFCAATSSTVSVRFRNSDNSGATARVSFEIHTSSLNSGGNVIIYTFTSDAVSGGGVFRTFSDTPAIDFDFANNIYWIEATIFRSDPSQLADLGTIQIFENAGAACP